MLELEELASTMNIKEYQQKSNEIRNSLEQFSDIPGISEFSNPSSELFKLLQKVSKLRNQNRWAVQAYIINCSVLGHLFDTGILSYFIGLEHFEFDEKIATNLHF